jgi:hypothetical protein
VKHENHEWFEKIIKFFEQQNDNSKFNTNEHHFFQKYLHITKIIRIESKRQCILDDFLVINNRYNFIFNNKFMII